MFVNAAKRHIVNGSIKKKLSQIIAMKTTIGFVAFALQFALLRRDKLFLLN